MTWVDAGEFRALFRAVPSAVGIVAVRLDGTVHATTVSSFCSVSLEPALLMVALHRESAILQTIREQGSFGLSVLAHDQEELARKGAERGAGSLGSQYWADESTKPRLAGAVAWAGCEIEHLYPGGDHELVVARVVDSQVRGGPALIHHARAYHRAGYDDRG
ncbi:MAG: flavin reductase family protein [Actinomycetales bacterium]